MTAKVFFIGLIFAVAGIVGIFAYKATVIVPPPPPPHKKEVRLDPQELYEKALKSPKVKADHALSQARLYNELAKINAGSTESKQNLLRAAIETINYLELSGTISSEEAYRRKQNAEQAYRIGMPITHGHEEIPKK